MAGFARSCIQSLLKLVNSGLGMTGVALSSTRFGCLGFGYVMKNRLKSLSLGLYTLFLVLGLPYARSHAQAILLRKLLMVYMAFVFLLFVLEAAVTADVFLNHNWEEDFPKDPTGNFDQLKDFIKANFDTCKWIGLTVVALQGLSMLLAMILKALGTRTERYYESDDDYLPDRVPLLKNYVPPRSYVVNEPAYGVKKDAWNM
ncbi:hypothetical protein OROGR_007443 [Orobanche gracilis]